MIDAKKTKTSRQRQLKLLLLVVLGLQMSFPWLKEELQSLDLASTVKTVDMEICGVTHTVDIQVIGDRNVTYTAAPKVRMESVCSDCTNVRGLSNRSFKSTLISVTSDGGTVDETLVHDINAILQAAQIQEALQRQIGVDAADAYDGDCAKMAKAIKDAEEDGNEVTADADPDDDEKDEELSAEEKRKIRACTHVAKNATEIRPSSETERANCRIGQLEKIARGEMDANDFRPEVTNLETFMDTVRGLSGEVEDLIEEWLESDSSADNRRARSMANKLRRTLGRVLTSSVANRMLEDQRLDSDERKELRELKEGMQEKMDSYVARGEYRESIVEVNADIKDYNDRSDELFARYGEFNEVAKTWADKLMLAAQTPSPLDDMQLRQQIELMKVQYPQYGRALDKFMGEYMDLWKGRGSAFKALNGIHDNELAALSPYRRAGLISSDIMSGYNSSYDSALNAIDLIGMLTADSRNSETYLPGGLTLANLYTHRAKEGLLALGGQNLVTALPAPTFSPLSTTLNNRFDTLRASPMRVRGTAPTVMNRTGVIPAFGTRVQ